MATSVASCGLSRSRLNLLREAVFRRRLASTSSASNINSVVLTNENATKYPPIVDTSYKASKERHVQQWHRLIQKLPTVQEKQVELNLSKYYGHWTCNLSSHDVRYNHAEFIQFATRTNVTNESWPDTYSSLDGEVNKLLPVLKQKVEDVLLLEVVHRSYKDRTEDRLEKEISDNIIWAINHALISLLSEDVDHIADSQSDLSPRLEAFWWLHGIPADSHQTALRRRNRRVPPEEQDAPVSRPVQYVGRPSLLVRSRLPLVQLVPADHPACRQQEPLPLQSREPRTRHCGYQYRHGTNIPGVWPEDPRQFGVVTWLSREHLLLHARRYGPHAVTDRADALHAQGCLTGFASCLAQACNLGFSPLTELTYPLTSQTVITSGRLWSFYAYQLNTTGALHTLPAQGQPGNVCWATAEMPLYESVTEAGVVGLNEEVLRKVLQMYLLRTSERGGIDLRPYLDPTESIASIEDEWLRQRYHEAFLHVMSNRPRHLLKDEIYLWEYIYKVRFQTRPIEALKRFYDHGKFPGTRRLDEFSAKYVPRALRSGFIPGRLKAASRHERNVYHEMALRRGNRDTLPKFMQELAALEKWREQQ